MTLIRTRIVVTMCTGRTSSASAREIGLKTNLVVLSGNPWLSHGERNSHCAANQPMRLFDGQAMHCSFTTPARSCWCGTDFGLVEIDSKM